MQSPNPPKNKQGRLSNHQREAYFQNMDRHIANLTIEDQSKMEYVKRFINKLPIIGLEEGDEITLGPLDSRMLHYLFYCVVLGYEESSMT